ncbi:MAG: hypothetical protein P8K79_04060, partial [Mariniblastus sp.]|nr:hypothetical protein [Mariniblastus sp.]
IGNAPSRLSSGSWNERDRAVSTGYAFPTQSQVDGERGHELLSKSLLGADFGGNRRVGIHFAFKMLSNRLCYSNLTLSATAT